VEERSIQKVLKERRMKRWAKARLRNADGHCAAPNLSCKPLTGIEQHPSKRSSNERGGGGVRCAEFNLEATIQTDVHWWVLRSTEMGRGIRVRNEIEDIESWLRSVDGN
jgi:hypothetical protein